MAQWDDPKYAELTSLLGDYIEFMVRDPGETAPEDQIKRLLGTFFLGGQLTPAEITADQNNYAPTGLEHASVLRISTDASRNITGLTGGIKFRLIAIVNVGSNDAVLKNENASSTAGNRFALDADLTLAAWQGCILWYDTTSSRWRCVAKTSAAAASGGKRVSSAASASSLTPDSSNYDVYIFTALAAALTINADTGTPTSEQPLVIKLKDNGTARALTWDAQYVARGAALPITTIINKVVRIGFLWNMAQSKWDCVAVAQEL